MAWLQPKIQTYSAVCGPHQNAQHDDDNGYNDEKKAKSEIKET